MEKADEETNVTGNSEEIIDGGAVVSSSSSPQRARGTTGEEIVAGDAGVHVDTKIKKDRADMAIKLAQIVLGTLIGSVLIHYAATITLMLLGRVDVVERVADLYDTWLAVIAGFAGSAITFFLTREK